MLDQFYSEQDLPTSLNFQRVGLDTETTGLNPWTGDRVFCLSIVFPDGRKIYWHKDASPGTRHIVEKILKDTNIHKVLANAKFDDRFLRFSGFPAIRGPVWDVQIFGHLLDGRDAGSGISLENLCRKYLPFGFRKLKEEIHKWFEENGMKDKADLDFSKLPLDLIRRRVESDAELTLMLFDKMYTTVRKLFPYLLWMEHALLPVIMEMEDRGIPVDPVEIEKQYEYFTYVIDEVTDFFECMTGWHHFNINATADQTAAFEICNIMEFLERDSSTERTKVKKTPKLNDFNLRNTHHPAAFMLLVGKACQKMRDTFLAQADRFQVDGILHAQFNQIGTCSGRFSSSKPNMQNIPKDADHKATLTEDEAQEMLDITGLQFAPHIKRIFRTREGYVNMHSDKCQAEMCVLAHYANDSCLSEIVESGQNIHSGLCRLLYNDFNDGLKTRTKATVFGYVYGAGLATTAKKIKQGIEVARDARERLSCMVPGLPKWRSWLEHQIQTQGYITTIHGRRHYLRGFESYKAVNRMCQGTIGDEMKGRMIDIDRYIKREGIDAGMLLQVHDDIGMQIEIGSAAKVIPEIRSIMERSHHNYNVPLRADCAVTYTRWADKMGVENPDDPSTFDRAAFDRYLEPKLREEAEEWAQLQKAYS
jgi:DNA polymerase-1